MRGTFLGVVFAGFLFCMGGLWLALAISNAILLLVLHIHHVVVCALNDHLRWCAPGSALHFGVPPLLLPGVMLALVALGVGARISPPVYRWWRFDRKWQTIAKRNAS